MPSKLITRKRKLVWKNNDLIHIKVHSVLRSLPDIWFQTRQQVALILIDQMRVRICCICGFSLLMGTIKVAIFFTLP